MCVCMCVYVWCVCGVCVCYADPHVLGTCMLCNGVCMCMDRCVDMCMCVYEFKQHPLTTKNKESTGL